MGYYAAHFAQLRKEPIKLLEIGIGGGASIKMWEIYFPNAELYAIDINPKCRRFNSPRTTVFIGDQADSSFLSHFIREVGGDFDIIIDDGGHTMEQQIGSFSILFPYVRPGGTYVIEDLHTSYDERYGGGKGGRSTVKFLKGLVDNVNRGYLGNNPNSLVTDEEMRAICGDLASIHFYPSIAFVHKKQEDEKRAIAKSAGPVAKIRASVAVRKHRLIERSRRIIKRLVDNG
jgi:hypothetical protein